MNLWSLLLPFKWFIIGVGVVLSSIFNVIKGIISLVGSLFNYLFKGVMIIFKGIIFFFKEIVFKYLFLAIRYIVIVLSKVLEYIGKALAFIITNVFEGLIYVIKGIFIVIKYIIIYLYKAIYIIFKYLFIVIKYIMTYLYKAIYMIFKYLYNGIKVVLTYLGKALKIVIVDCLIKYIGFAFSYLFKGVVAILNALIKVPLLMWDGLKVVGKKIYTSIVYPFAYLGKNFKRIMDSVKAAIKKFNISAKALPGKISKNFKGWYNNLTFVKDARNKRELKREALLIDFDAEDARSETKLTYHYVAKNPNGKIEKGFLGAYSKLDVHSYLLSEGYEVYEIEQAKGFRMSRAITHKIRTSELVFFLTQLSTYIKAGIPLVDSIKILGKQSKRSSTKELYKAIIYDLTMGDNFSEALEKQSSAFPRLLVNMVKSAEMAGNLSETLDDMAEYYTSVSKTKRQMKSAMTYPTVIFVFATGVVVFLLTYVIPSFVDMYKQMDADVPTLTMAIIAISDFLSNNILYVLLGVIIVIVGFYLLYKNVKLFRSIIQWILMHMPIIGKIIIYNEVTMFSKTFASLWNHNVFITQSMEILSKITNNEIYKMLIFDAITNVARGDPVSSSFKNHWAFPVVAYEMLVTGERTGQPGPMMAKVAEYYDEEHRNAVNSIKTFIEPALIVFLAVVVGIILLAVVLPMFDIYGKISAE